METVKSGNVPALVTNLEVMNMLKSNMDQRRAELQRQRDQDEDENENMVLSKEEQEQLRHRDWIEKRVFEYLSGTPCADLQHKTGEDGMQDVGEGEKDVSQLVAILKKPPPTDEETQDGQEGEQAGFGLTDGECLQILNHVPTELVELHLMIEDLPSRLSEERQTELLELIASYRVVKEEAGGGEEDWGEGDEHYGGEEDGYA